MSAPRKYDQEFRERAVRMYRERLAEPGESKRGARRHVGLLLDLNPETLRNWVEERDRVESGRSPAPRSAESEEVRALRRRVAELERANEILKTSAAFFAQAELDRRLDDRGLHRLPPGVGSASSRSVRSWPRPGSRSRRPPTTPAARLR